MALFDAAITPIVTYGLEIIWEYLSYTDLKRIENVKSRFLKLAIGVSKSAPSRKVYE